MYVEPGKSAAGKMERVQIGDLGPDLGLASCRNNTDALKSPLPLNKLYFENYLGARYSEKEDYALGLRRMARSLKRKPTKSPILFRWLRQHSQRIFSVISGRN